MERLNGWQRIWVVLTALWITGILALGAIRASNGAYQSYQPPVMQEWILPCSVDAIADDPRKRFHADYTDLSDEEFETAIVKKYSAVLANSETSSLHYWLPKGVDGSSDQITCASADVVFNPKANRMQLEVLVRPTFEFTSWHKGYDFESAIKEPMELLGAEAQRNRRDALLMGGAFAVIPPPLLYGLGFVFVWIRRGFRQ